MTDGSASRGVLGGLAAEGHASSQLLDQQSEEQAFAALMLTPETAKLDASKAPNRASLHPGFPPSRLQSPVEGHASIQVSVTSLGSDGVGLSSWTPTQKASTLAARSPGNWEHA